MIRCREFQNFFIDYLEGNLPAPKLRVFEHHLKLCRECCDYLAVYQASLKIAKQAMADKQVQIDIADVPEDLIAAVIAAQKAK